MFAPQNQDSTITDRSLSALLGGLGSHALNKGAIKAYVEGADLFDSPGKPNIPIEIYDSLLKKVKDSGIDVRYVNKGGYYNDYVKPTVIAAPRYNIGTLSHEFGHDLAHKASKKGKLLSAITHGAKIENIGSRAALISSGLSLADFIYKGPSNRSRNLSLLGSLGLGIMHIPGEMDASIRGLREISSIAKQKGHKLTLKQKLAPFAGVPSYAMVSMFPIMAYGIASALNKQVFNKERRKNKFYNKNRTGGNLFGPRNSRRKPNERKWFNPPTWNF